MLNIEIPNNQIPERTYIISVIFEEFFGIEVKIQVSSRKDVSITCEDGQAITVADLFLGPSSTQWLRISSLPEQPLAHWDFAETGLTAITVGMDIPVIYGEDLVNGSLISLSAEHIYLGLDIFGSAFFMLTRYEEAVKPNRDGHDRFPATASLAYQEGFLDRPIINEYLEILWACLKHLWPRLKRKARNFQTYLSHDVDAPFKYALSGSSTLARTIVGNFIRRKPHCLGSNLSSYMQVKAQGKLEADPFYTYDLIMDISEQQDLRSAFYFITDHTAERLDGNYRISHPLIRNLLKKIHQRGHEIGLHTSYNTYRNSTQTQKEFEILKKVCNEEGVRQECWGGRQHYLRWEAPNTFQNWEDAGLNYDSTLSFSDVAGFRCGVCFEFTTFSLKTRQHLRLKERPLIIMECTILDRRYMNLGLDGHSSLQTMAKYKQRCRLFSGDFSLLWHNNRLVDPREANLYRAIVSF